MSASKPSYQDQVEAQDAPIGAIPSPVTIVKEPLKVLFKWSSPARPFRKRDREFYTTAGSIIFLVCVILLFIKEFLLIMVIMAFAFLIYMLNNVKPDLVEHEITNQGIRTLKKLYVWEQLGRFWFDKKDSSWLLYIENGFGFPPRLMLVFEEKDKDTIKKYLEKYLLLEKPEKTQMERAGEWLQKKIPLETSPTKTSSVPATKK